jgi:TetR/AcrR family transcriptional repressor of nem operon
MYKTDSQSFVHVCTKKFDRRREMGRPKGFDREEAIETAMQEIWRSGYEANTVKALSERLGITRSSYYNAFGSREALFKAALARYFSQSPDRILHGDLPDVPVLVLLTRTFREISRVRAGDPERKGCLAINSLAELVGTNQELGPLLVHALLTSAARLEELLNIAVENGELPPGTDTHAKALALQNLMIGLNVFAKALGDEDELWLMAKTTLDGLGLYREAEHAGI